MADTTNAAHHPDRPGEAGTPKRPPAEPAQGWHEHNRTLGRRYQAGIGARNELAHATTDDQRRELHTIIADGDRAQQQLLETNRGLLRMWVQRYRFVLAHKPYDELLDRAGDGFLTALRHWNPDGGAALSTWVAPQIRSRLHNEVKRLYGHRQAPVVMRIVQSARRLEDELGRPATVDDIAADIGLSADRVKAMLDHAEHARRNAAAYSFDTAPDGRRPPSDTTAADTAASDTTHRHLPADTFEHLSARHQRLGRFLLDALEHGTSTDEAAQRYARTLGVPAADVHTEIRHLADALSADQHHQHRR